MGARTLMVNEHGASDLRGLSVGSDNIRRVKQEGAPEYEIRSKAPWGHFPYQRAQVQHISSGRLSTPQARNT